MISVAHKGNFNKTEKFFNRAKKIDLVQSLEKYGDIGVNALAQATPIDSGNTAAQWHYTVEQSSKSVKINWSNSNVNNGVNIAVILHYGHGTGTGGYVAGREYIPKAIEPVFDTIVSSVWEEVTSK